MSQQKVQDLMRQVHSSRVKYVYSALVDIKKNLINSSKGVERLVSNGLVHRLLQIIRSRDNLEEKYRSKVIELSISLLGNMCMEEVSRKQVIKLGGIELLVELFAETETESLQNRTCRCLANMLLTPGSWELAHKTSIVELISKRLDNTDLKEDTKKTYIRAIRLLGQTGYYVRKVVEMNAVGAVLKYVDCDSEEVCQSVLRCLNSLSTHGCSIQFATQVVASGKIPYLIDLIKHHNEDAFHLVVRLHNNHNFRPEFGNAGGIAASYEMFNLDDTNTEKWKPDLLNVLCLCCKEAVNRVKLREQNILKVFLESLSDKRFTSLHQRIVSALMCFLYDEPSIEVLLENGMVKVLIQLLNSYMYGSDGDNGSDISRIEDNDVSVQESGSDVTIAAFSPSDQNITGCKYVCGDVMKTLSDKACKIGTVISERFVSHSSGGDVKSAHIATETQSKSRLVKGDTLIIESVECEDVSMINNPLVHLNNDREEGLISDAHVESAVDEDEADTLEEKETSVYQKNEIHFVSDSDQLTGDFSEESLLSVKDIDIHSQNENHSAVFKCSASDISVTTSASTIEAIDEQTGSDLSRNCPSSATSYEQLISTSSETLASSACFANSSGDCSEQSFGQPGNTVSSSSLYGNECSVGVSVDDSMWSESAAGDTTTAAVVTSSDGISLQTENDCDESDLEVRETLRPVYSINSPTYGSPSDRTWESSYWEGAKCIESFSPSHPSTIARQNSYSPFSNVSYYSPQKSSPEFSPGPSPSWSQTPPMVPYPNLNTYPGPCHSSYYEDPLSPSQLSSQNARHLYTGINCRIYNTDLSPIASPERAPSVLSGTSPKSSTSVCSEGSPQISSDDELKIVPSYTSVATSSSAEEVLDKPLVYEYSPVSSPVTVEKDCVLDESEVLEQETLKSDKDMPLEVTPKSNEQSFTSDTSMGDSPIMETVSEMFLNRKINKVASKSTVFENNILILLSRVSQMNDPTAYLVTKEVLCCLLDYISIMEAPLARCARLLSRIFRNPACFKKLISLHVPTLIYCTLLHGVDVTTYRTKMASAKWASSFVDAQREVSSDSDRYSMTDEDEIKPYKRRRLSEDISKQTQTYKGVYHQQEEEVCVAAKCGLAFLEDLSCVADSQYGHGTSDRLFHTLPGNQHLDICITLTLIVWSAGARQFYFHHREVLDLVLSLLQDVHVTPTPQFSLAVMALSFLAKIIDTKKKYQSTKFHPKLHCAARAQSKEFKSLWHQSKTDKMLRDQSKTIDMLRDQSKVDEIPRDQSKIDEMLRDRSKSSELVRDQSITLDQSKYYCTDSHSLKDIDKVVNGMDECKNSATNDDIVSDGAKLITDCEWQTNLPMDIVFITKDGKVQANKSTLIKQSEVFSAMLMGHYSEAHLSQISIPETSTNAFCYINHYMHGCKRRSCPVLQYLYSVRVSIEMVLLCIEVIFEADKWMLIPLKDQMTECLCNRLIIPEACQALLKYSTICSVDKVRKAAVSSLLTDSLDCVQLIELTADILRSDLANVFLHTLIEIFVEA